MTYTHEQDLPTRHILNGSRAPEQLLAGVGVNGKQLPAKRGSKRTGTLLLAGMDAAAMQQLSKAVWSKQEHVGQRRSSLITSSLLMCCPAVLALLLLRYVVEVKVTFSWRALPWHLTARHGVRHCSNTCFKVRVGLSTAAAAQRPAAWAWELNAVSLPSNNKLLQLSCCLCSFRPVWSVMAKHYWWHHGCVAICVALVHAGWRWHL